MTEPQGGSDPTLLRDHGPDATATSGSSTGGSSSRPTPGRRRFLIVMAVTDPDDRRLPGDVDVPRPDRHPRGRDRPQHRADGRAWPPARGHARPHPLRRGAGARPRACSGARARPSPSPRPGSAAGGSTTPCGRWGCASKALDMMCERAVSRQTQRRPAGRQAERAELRRRLLHRSSSSSGCSCLYVAWEHRPGTRTTARSATTSPRSRCSPPRSSTTSSSGPSRSTGRSASPTRCPSARLWMTVAGHGPRRRADRGAPRRRWPARS